MKILAIAGSLRKESWNGVFLRAFEKQLPEGVTMEIADISEVPLFNQDMVDDLLLYPKAVTDLKEKMLAADAVMVATPEYNRGMPGVLKNLIDWTVRPKGTSSWTNKPTYVMGATPGKVGTLIALGDLRKVLVGAGAYVFGKPEFSLNNAKERFDAQGNVIDEETRERIQQGIDLFVPFAKKLS